MSEDEVRLWLRFTTVTKVGPRKQIALLSRFGTPEAVFAAKPAELAEVLSPLVLKAWLDSPDIEETVQQTLAWQAEEGNRLLCLGDADYPPSLLDLPDAPVLLYIKGRTDLLSAPALAIVGSRNASPQGIMNAREFAQSFSGAGLSVVSGLAAGIDAAAHQGALAAPSSTIAVVGTGLDRVYPASNRELAHQIATDGVILSELALGSPPKAEHFPRRNRIIAALGLGCLVVEATVGSGSLITAKQAADIGRDVFAIPGSIHSPMARGCHQLIKQGAKLVESAEDVLSELAWASPVQEPGKQKASKSSPFLQNMGFDPVDIETLSQRSGLTTDRLSAMLLTLELEGCIVALPGSRYQRIA
ncbi:DNA-processing protein DprA [Iodobacter fluviatilis]|uniref:DNA protecting protein DprA n=1 Tax=Iodobacter fluviatilis TaxID=537 RepID=A0A377Q2R7_9NEIS|nr:DNA-processing protein DprA [Iodobacter fluviatilis]TCU90048.1 DNA protecting protein DprA [Iodobacter fluviatilis]STQ89075.1 DNA protecting protein DprA [Iodobacter fluviatilis]